MKTIKINFSDFWKNFNIYDNFIFNDLSKRYHVIIDKNPDYLFYSCYGYKHFSFDCVKVFYSGENVFPDFNECDYAIGSYHLEFGDRYIRAPLSGRRFYLGNILDKNIDNQNVIKRKFCNFVYSNVLKADPFRVRFLNELSEYKTVDCGGKLFNNIGGPVKDKVSFLSNYKFTIAFENSSVSGYSTEKIVEPMSVNSIPIYWGDPYIDKDYNVESFIWVMDKSDTAMIKAIDEIIELDQDDSLYLEKLSKPWLKNEQMFDYPQRISAFLDRIIDKPLDIAIKRPRYGFIISYKPYYNTFLKHYRFIRIVFSLFHRIKKLLKKAS